MDLRLVLRSLCDALAAREVDFALIGGLALASRGAPRATGAVDILVAGEDAEAVHEALSGLGYTARHRTEDVANYTSAHTAWGGVDVLFARRPYSREMLRRASEEAVLGDATIRVLQAEDLIGLKVQSSSNDPRRAALDRADIERLLAASRTLDLERVREYFRLFEREAELEAILLRVSRC